MLKEAAVVVVVEADVEEVVAVTTKLHLKSRHLVRKPRLSLLPLMTLSPS